jgi:hypothetical protein
MNKNNNQYAELTSRVGDHNRNSLIKLFYGSDRHPIEGQLDSIKHHMMMGDPLADAVVNMYGKFPAGKGRELVIQAIENGIDSIVNPPQELRVFFFKLIMNLFG